MNDEENLHRDVRVLHFGTRKNTSSFLYYFVSETPPTFLILYHIVSDGCLFQSRGENVSTMVVELCWPKIKRVLALLAFLVLQMEAIVTRFHLSHRSISIRHCSAIA